MDGISLASPSTASNRHPLSDRSQALGSHFGLWRQSASRPSTADVADRIEASASVATAQRVEDHASSFTERMDATVSTALRLWNWRLASSCADARDLRIRRQPSVLNATAAGLSQTHLTPLQHSHRTSGSHGASQRLQNASWTQSLQSDGPFEQALSKRIRTPGQCPQPTSPERNCENSTVGDRTYALVIMALASRSRAKSKNLHISGVGRACGKHRTVNVIEQDGHHTGKP